MSASYIAQAHRKHYHCNSLQTSLEMVPAVSARKVACPSTSLPEGPAISDSYDAQANCKLLQQLHLENITSNVGDGASFSPRKVASLSTSLPEDPATSASCNVQAHCTHSNHCTHYQHIATHNMHCWSWCQLASKEGGRDVASLPTSQPEGPAISPSCNAQAHCKYCNNYNWRTLQAL